ncbi:hypothetical protein NC653_008235 [Populus alba x Populus x berolinensis]|uniref:Uncharacterized protein n=1 Tax=Populus alba x Populus x berolinensis TaxID=444605 RepID=A0AAD6W877_9ROSI|nr:hypothetical protein NC653_008235 [Populus alba x Populus x berolinensis]
MACHEKYKVELFSHIQGLFVMDGFFDTLLPTHWASKTLLAIGSRKDLQVKSSPPVQIATPVHNDPSII